MTESKVVGIEGGATADHFGNVDVNVEECLSKHAALRDSRQEQAGSRECLSPTYLLLPLGDELQHPRQQVSVKTSTEQFLHEYFMIHLIKSFGEVQLDNHTGHMVVKVVAHLMHECGQ